MKKFSFWLLILVSCNLFPQVISEPVESDVYHFLFSLQNKTLFNQPVRVPLTREQLRSKFEVRGSMFKVQSTMYKEEGSRFKVQGSRLGNEGQSLTELEKGKLDYYLNELADSGYESSFLKNKKRFYHLYSFRDENFSFILDPVFTAAYQKGNEGSVFYRNGLYARGSFLKNWGYSLLFYDQHSDLKGNYKYNYFSRKPGIHVAVREGDFSELRGGIWYDFGFGRVSAAKDFLKIGSGMDGQIILSNKAPSFPYLNLELEPAKWINFNYYLGFLSSVLPDSSTLRILSTARDRYNYTIDRRDKYIALHYLTFYPVSTLSVTLGESVIFSDRLEYLYLIPVMFFRLADHYYSHGDTGDNAQIFLDASYRYLPLSAKIYFTLFIDELQITKFLSGDDDANKHFGYTVGSHITDPVIKNSSLIIEYTRINPFVYNNFNPAQTYHSSGYQLGHWIGSNADQIHIGSRFNVQCSMFDNPGFGFIEIWFDYIRKGKKETVDEQYTFPNPEFLYGGISYYSDIGISLNWEPVNSLKIKLEYVRHLKSTGRFISEYEIKEKEWIEFSVGFGL